MITYLTRDLVVDLIFFQIVVLMVILSNIVLLHHARRHNPPPSYPKVSILVPARNEENNIANCIRSLLEQDYPDFEVLVLDDQSCDGTLAILRGMADSRPGLKVLAGSPPPEGRLGKNWACFQLAQAAQGDLLLFTDADTVHRPASLCCMVTALAGEDADLLTGFPRQEMHTWMERLLVPFFSWAVLCFNPLCLAYRMDLPVLSNAVGQMMLFRREGYQAIGGHGRSGSSIVEDLTLARRIKAAGLRWRVVHVSDLVTCRMYPGGQEAFDGFSRNYFAAFDFRLLPYLFVFLWLAVMFWQPLILLAVLFSRQVPTARLVEPIVCVGLSLLLWFIPYLELKVHSGLGILYPFTILVNVLVAFRSLLLSLSGRLTWKGRTISRPKWKWI
jgi:chlorobactene glucosyltransferase